MAEGNENGVRSGLEHVESVGEKLSDWVSERGGSWRFILVFAALLVGWMLWNVAARPGRAFDPYPFVFLNLVLAVMSTVQWALVQMSANRQAARDREAVETDRETNRDTAAVIREMRDLVLELQAETRELRHRLDAATAGATADVLARTS